MFESLRDLCCFPECDITCEYYYNLFLFNHKLSHKNALQILGNGKPPPILTQTNELLLISSRSARLG